MHNVRSGRGHRLLSWVWVRLHAGSEKGQAGALCSENWHADQTRRPNGRWEGQTAEQGSVRLVQEALDRLPALTRKRGPPTSRK